MPMNNHSPWGKKKKPGNPEDFLAALIQKIRDAFNEEKHEAPPPQNGEKPEPAHVAAGVAKVVLVILSGRPLVMDPSVVEGCSAIVAAWLPGSRGIGVADVLFGDVNFSGKLPHTWPANFEQIPVNVNKQSDEPGTDAASTAVLYPYGHGLSYP